MKYIVDTADAYAISSGHASLEKTRVVVPYFINGKSQRNIGNLDWICRAVLWRLLQEDARLFDYVLPHFEELKRARHTLEWKTSLLKDILVQIVTRQRHC